MTKELTDRWVTVAPDGTFEVRYEKPDLERLQQAVSGYIEALPSPMPDTAIMVNDSHNREDGTPLAMNPKATGWLKDVLWPGQRIVGTLVIAGAPTEDGELTALTDEQVMSLREKLT